MLSTFVVAVVLVLVAARVNAVFAAIGSKAVRRQGGHDKAGAAPSPNGLEGRGRSL
jgi:hypothetical protein